MTEVIFRKQEDGQIVALFPYEIWSSYFVTCYQHVGQHGGASYDYVIKITTPATEEEYKPLKKELEDRDYKLTLIQRINNTRYRKALTESRAV